jgi:hypothetical protein
MNKTKTPRSLWPISITAFFIVLITCIVSFVAFAMRQREDLVSADYYERAVRYEKQLDALNRSQKFAARTVVTFDPAKQTIVIALPEAQHADAAASVNLYRPSDARLDREIPMQLDAAGVQRLDARDLSDGLWRVRVNWKQSGQDYFLDQPVIVSAD